MHTQNKHILVTGAGSGIGRELTLALVRKGATVAAVDIHESSLAETVSLVERSDAVTTHITDITDEAAVGTLAKTITKDTPLDGIINNAGIIQPFVKVNDLETPDIRRVMDVNFFGMLNMTKAFLPVLLKRPEAHIVNISSMGGFLPVPGQSVYGASKAAVKLLTEGLYAELRNTNVHVTVVFPGATQTNIAENSGVDISGVATEDAASMPSLPANIAAEKIIRAMEKNAFRVCVGKDSKMMDVLYRLSPKFATGFIAKQMQSLLGE